MAEVKWIKIVTDIFDDEKILLIEAMPEADSLITIWFKLLCLAGKQNNSGVFMLNDRIAYTDEMFATIFRRKLTTVRLALSTFENLGMIEIVNGAVTIPNWSKHQTLDQLEHKTAYMREYMAKKRAEQRLIADGKANGKANSKTNSQANVSCADKDIDKNRLEEDKNKNTPKPDFPAIIAEYTENEELRETLTAFIQYRKDIRKPMNENTVKLMLNKLNKLGQTDAERVEVLNQSMVNGWQGIFELKREAKAKAEADAKQAEHDAIWEERLKRCINL